MKNTNKNDFNATSHKTDVEERKQKLIEALKSERLIFAERGHNTTEHDIAIQFLLLGETSYNPYEWGLLDAIMNDFATVCSDYGC